MSTQFADPSTPYTVVTPCLIGTLLSEAKQAPLLRARLCLHSSLDNPLHEMIIAFWQGSYVPPHRHRGKTESFHILTGEIDVVFFAENGELASRVTLSAENPILPRVYRLAQPLWHTVLIRSHSAVIHETTNGPFRPAETETAAWAPDQNDTEAIARFFARVRA